MSNEQGASFNDVTNLISGPIGQMGMNQARN